jgi:uncharacterized protein
MSEQDILSLIREDSWMMEVLQAAERLGLPDWLIGAGFVRNKVWDRLHGFQKEKGDTNDIDLVYFDPGGNDEAADERISGELGEKTGLKWEVVNQAYAHKWHGAGLAPYTSTEDAISKWPETATCIGVTMEGGQLKLVAPYGIEDLVNMIVKPSPGFIKEKSDAKNVVAERARSKKWLEKWPKLTI